MPARCSQARLRGSSPRVRGTGSMQRPTTSEPSVHPRVCGERSFPISLFPSLPGSSPRVRGTEGPQDRGGLWAAVHPRVCGERQRFTPRPSPTFDGSSPRVRGTAHPDLIDIPLIRFIPACAGNGTKSTSRAGGCRFIPACAGNGRQTSRVHPRCAGAELGCRLTSGSSPRVRGTDRQESHWSKSSRFIPACAGNGCRPHLVARRPCRFIPACAGNGRRGSRRWSPRTVHPRVCGERAGAHRAIACCIGSSPRVRGTVALQVPA